jgi:very-short-patch-repair endonuclease
MSALEAEMLLWIKAEKLEAGMEREWRFNPDRRWRLDFSWPQAKVALEVEGGVWNGGRHTRASGFLADCEKYNDATLRGWKVFRVAAPHIKSGEAVRWIKEALK